MQAALKAAVRPNVGFARSPALTDAASIVRYWRHQLSANRNRIGLSTCLKVFAVKHDLPVSIQSKAVIFTHLHAAWTDLRAVQRKADVKRSEWIHEQADALAEDMKTTRAVALKQMARESDMKSAFKRMQPVSKGERSGAITKVKVPIHEWMYYEKDDVLFH